MENIYAERIASLRSMMRSRGWDAVIITGSDPHSSEYPAERWMQVRFLTGFTGETGDVVVTLDHAGLWTDSRYFIQAVSQLEGSGVELHKTRIPEQVLIPEWLSRVFAGDEVTIAVDGDCVSEDFISETDCFLKENGVESWFASVPDLLGPIWRDRPGIPQTPIFTVETGESRQEKLAWFRSWLDVKGADGMLLTALDDIAWMLNVRASDIEYNPLVISYLLVTKEDVVWYVLKDRVEDPETRDVLAGLSEEIRIEDYDFTGRSIVEEQGGRTILADSSTTSYELWRTLEQSPVRLEAFPSPVQLRKAVKNPTEIERIRRTHVADGVAMEKFLYWLEKSIDADRRVTEWDAAVKLGQLRAAVDGYTGDSFETISAYGPGAALPHYITPRVDAPELEAHGLYLSDSGGQYYTPDGELGGTTDITRTVPLGPCTELEKEDYTLVLKGHIGLAMAVFPAGTAGCQLDALARGPLWRARRSFGHGTGHGVGFMLGCHEGPQNIRQNFNEQALLPGMVTSDEPGIYREGMHGIRHENLLLCVEDGENEFGRWLRFEPLTLCHFDTSAIEPALLGRDEVEWLNEYNSRVYETLSPYLTESETEWLRVKTAAL